MNKSMTMKRNEKQVNEQQLKELILQVNNISINLYEMKYQNNYGISIIQRLISKFPSLYILLNSNSNGIKNSLINIMGYNAIKKNHLCDIGYYLTNNADVRLSGMDPPIHYLYYDFKEVRNPNKNLMEINI